ncbi:MAG: hypothetical protein V1894_04260 [Chloroflexota bacterium]
MDKHGEILKEIAILFKEGIDLQIEGEPKKLNLAELSMKYESWYTKASNVIQQIVPERLEDFKSAYKLEKRKQVNYETYTISDYLMGLAVTWAGEPTFNTTQAYQTRLLRQISILKSAMSIAPSVLRDIRTILCTELLDNDVEAAKELAKANHLRSAGVVCGVVLETHLKSVNERLGITQKKKDPSISELNDSLKNANHYDIPTWRFIQRLADIRNLCGHSKEREPTSDEVKDLIAGTEKIIKEIS